MTLMGFTEELGKRVKARRVSLHLSQREAAQQLGISERTLQNWEAGTTIPWPKHRRLLERFLQEDPPAEVSHG
jgi:transcriptional regulator with XRE-family HTH domain